MKKGVVFRRANQQEKESIVGTIQKNFGDVSLEPFNNAKLWIKEGSIKEVFLLNPHVELLIEDIPCNIDFSGVPIGSFREEIFDLEIEGAKLILPYTDRIVKVKTEQFLYGKPIFIANIEKPQIKFDKQEWVIIVGRNNLHYGVGQTEISSESLETAEPNTIFIRGYKNKPRDRGWYLRKGK